MGFRSNLLGAAIRIDVDSGDDPYGIPPDNPYVDVPGALPELYAIGFRNPWRATMDPGDRESGKYDMFHYIKVFRLFFIYLFIYLFVCFFVCLFVYLFIYLFICLFVYLFIYLFIEFLID